MSYKHAIHVQRIKCKCTVVFKIISVEYVTCFVESIFRMDPKTEVTLAFSSLYRDRTSSAWTERSHLAVGTGGMGGGGVMERVVVVVVPWNRSHTDR